MRVTIDDLTDETIKSALYPRNPYDDYNLLEEKLSAEFSGVLNITEEIPIFEKLSDIYFDTNKVLSALVDGIKKQDSAAGEPVEFELGILKQAISQAQPLRRLDGRLVNKEKDFEGKYILACSLSLPDMWDSAAWDLANKSRDLYKDRSHSFEMIILTQIIHGWESHVDFDDFFKPFDPSCIVVPLEIPSLKPDQALLLDPSQEVVLCEHVGHLQSFGSADFPFTDPIKLWHDDELIPLSPSLFFGLPPSYKVLRKIPGTKPLQEEHRCISEFDSKLVYLYLYTDGLLLNTLYNTVVSLRKKGIELEILTAYAGACNYHNPHQFEQCFSSLIAQRDLSWWIVPYNSSWYCLDNPVDFHDIYGHNDKLVVFDQRLEYGDDRGLDVMAIYGESMYPFTLSSMVHKVTQEVTQVTLQFLFDRVTRLFKDGLQDKSVLQGKNVLVCFDAIQSNTRSVSEQFASWHKSLKEKKLEFEAVFVSLYSHQEYCKPEYYRDWGFEKQPWTIFLDDEADYRKYVVDNFFLRLFKYEFSTVVAFQKDGRIASLLAHSLPSDSNVLETYPTFGHLSEEVRKIFYDCANKRFGRDI